MIAALELGWILKEIGHPDRDIAPPLTGLDPSGTGDEKRKAQAAQEKAQIAGLKLDGLTAETQAIGTWLSAIDPPPGSDGSEPQPAPDPETARPAVESRVLIELIGPAPGTSPHSCSAGLREMLPTPPDATESSESTTEMIDALDLLSADLASHAARGVALSMSDGSRAGMREK